MERQLRQAIESNELTLNYQPQVDIKTGGITGVEALLRWNSAELGPVSPAEFIRLAEEANLIAPIGDWVLRTACTQAKAWYDASIFLGRIAVNVSMRQFAQAGFPYLVKRILDETGLAPSALEIEITESVLIKDHEMAIVTLRELKDLGI